MEYTRMFKTWFHGAPQNAKKASATLTFDGVISDGEEVVIGDNTYEFDRDSNLENGLAIAADMTNYLTKANATLTYLSVPVVTKTITLGAAATIEIYEIVAAADEVTDPDNIPVVLGSTLTADNAVTVLAQVINANSALVTAVANTITDTLVITAIAGGTGANTLAIATTETNASFGESVTTLSGGLNTCTAADGAACIVNAINTNTSEIVSAVVNGSTAVVSYKVVGTDGNSVAVSTDAVSGTWGAEVTALSGGQYATPCQTACYIDISGTWYFASIPVTKWTENGWYSAALTLL